MRSWARLRRCMTNQIVRYAIIGLVTTLLDIALADLLYVGAGWDGWVAKTTSTSFCIVLSYVLNRNWTFGDRKSDAMGREALLFGVFNVLGLGIQLGMISLAQVVMAGSALMAFNLGQVGGLVLSTVVRYLAYRLWVFVRVPEVLETNAPAALTSW